MRYFLDCEFDGAFGELISIALVPETHEDGDDHDCFYEVSDYVLDEDGNCRVKELWVGENVLPLLGPQVPVSLDDIQHFLEEYLDGDQEPTFICDHPADVMYLSNLLILRRDPANTVRLPPRYTFEVAYTKEMQAFPVVNPQKHNALSDAKCLRLSYMAAHG